MMITKPQIIKIKTQLRQLGLDSELMALTYSDDRTERISGLQYKEASTLIKKLEEAQKQTPDNLKKDLMARKIISMAHELGWQNPLPPEGGKPKADMQRINKWCVTYGYLKKKLDDHTKDEMVKLVTGFENMYVKELRKV